MLALACTKKKVGNDTALLGLEYYPKTLGKFVEYDVDSTVYIDLPLSSVTYKYRIKEKITGYFLDNEGNEALRLERFIKKYDPAKPYDSMAYTIKEVWMVNADKRKVEVVEGNIRYTKLVFPVSNGTSWNGNIRNTLGEWNYMYDGIDLSEVMNGINLNKVLKVVQKSERTQIAYKNYVEKYAKGVGLVYREIIDVTSNNVLPNVPVEQRIEKGVIYKQKIVNNGYE
ncbi:MAG: hypothetical protein ACK50A_13415 [Sphingobacteriaceae bacterium]|jgi:hypothetical protein